MTRPAISPDTEATLLLCGRFGRERDERFSPLTTREYAELARALIAAEMRPADLLVRLGAAALEPAWQGKLQRERIEYLIGRGTLLALALERWSRGGVWVMSRGDARFPRRLKQHLGHSAPPLLYGSGDQALLDAGGLAIVGSRSATASALEYTRRIAGCCAREGIAVVSGGARGVDESAMQGVIEEGGIAIGVLPANLLKAGLSRQTRINLQDGQLVLVSPFHPESSFSDGVAMARNRYIYTLADCALVIDSALGSGGTWHGAIEDLKHGWVPLHVRLPGDGAGNVGLIERRAAAFEFDPLGSSSLKQYLAERQHATPQSEACSANLLQPSLPLTVEQRPEHEVQEDLKSRVETLLAGGPRSPEDLASSLGIAKKQMNAYLKRACADGWLEELVRPVRYALARQRLLC